MTNTVNSALIIGMGRFGRHAARKMFELHREVLAVDKEESNINAVLDYVTNALIGDSTDEQFLKSLGVSNFDVCIVAIGEDFQASLETTWLLKELGARRVVARASQERHERFLLRNGADEVIYPEKQVAEWTAIRSASEQIFDYFALNRDYAIFELSVPEEWVGKTLGSLDARRKYGVNVLALKKGDVLNMTVTPDTVFQGGDKMLALGKNDEVLRHFK